MYCERHVNARVATEMALRKNARWWKPYKAMAHCSIMASWRPEASANRRRGISNVGRDAELKKARNVMVMESVTSRLQAIAMRALWRETGMTAGGVRSANVMLQSAAFGLKVARYCFQNMPCCVYVASVSHQCLRLLFRHAFCEHTDHFIE